MASFLGLRREAKRHAALECGSDSQSPGKAQIISIFRTLWSGCAPFLFKSKINIRHSSIVNLIVGSEGLTIDDC
ncbi:MAG: hypothetical protein CFE26_04565 [Verrucomicrobiales bacterium VVV1]|nr:MAG: hypothetical protein CFE26_04565 [Verrucomicrobiales bacterium VVV1]